MDGLGLSPAFVGWPAPAHDLPTAALDNAGRSALRALRPAFPTDPWKTLRVSHIPTAPTAAMPLDCLGLRPSGRAGPLLHIPERSISNDGRTRSRPLPQAALASLRSAAARRRRARRPRRATRSRTSQRGPGPACLTTRPARPHAGTRQDSCRAPQHTSRGNASHLRVSPMIPGPCRPRRGPSLPRLESLKPAEPVVAASAGPRPAASEDVPLQRSPSHFDPLRPK